MYKLVYHANHGGNILNSVFIQTIFYKDSLCVIMKITIF